LEDAAGRKRDQGVSEATRTIAVAEYYVYTVREKERKRKSEWSVGCNKRKIQREIAMGV
jgi:hypothetical protein